MTTTFMLIFASALVMAIGGTPVVRRIALRLGIIDPVDRGEVPEGNEDPWQSPEHDVLRRLRADSG